MSQTDSRRPGRSECLSEESLSAFVHGAGESADLSAIAAHVETCDSCRKAVRDERLFSELQQAYQSAHRPGSSHPLAWDSHQDGSPSLPTIEGYRLEREIHHGGQGIVFEAVQLATNRRVALKVILYGTLSSPAQRRRFEREIDLAAGLRHPHIVTIYDSGIQDGKYFYAMELIDGVRLNEFVAATLRPSGSESASNRKQWVRRTAALMKSICEAVAYAHQKGVIHRDLKPANILISSDGTPHIVDFGLAKTISDLEHPAELAQTKSGEIIGTILYASPEQLSGDSRSIDTRSDVYSLGVILYELLTDNVPFDSREGLAKSIQNILSDEPIPPSRRQPAIDAELDTIILKALSKEPDRRYPSAEHLSRDLGYYLNDQPIEAKRDRMWYVMRKSLRRHRWLFTASCTLLIVILVSLFVSLTFWSRAAIDRDAAIKSRQIAEAAQAAETDARVNEQRLRLIAQDQRHEAELQAYIANISAAIRARYMHDVSDCETKLRRAPTEFRGWEWYHLESQLDGSLLSFDDHSSYVEDVAISPDDRWLATVGWDHKFCVYDLSSNELHSVYVTDAPIWCCEISPDSRSVVIGVWDGTVVEWDIHSRSIIYQYKVSAEAVHDVHYSPDGNRIAAVSMPQTTTSESTEKTLLEWDRVSHAVTQQIKFEEAAPAFAYHPDGQQLAIAYRGVRLYDAASGQWQKTLTDELVQDVAYAESGKWLLTAKGSVAELWNLETLQIERTFDEHASQVHAVAFGPGADTVLTSSRDKTIRIWDVSTGDAREVLCGHKWVITAIAVNSDGSRLFSGSWDRSVKQWDGKSHSIRDLLIGHQDKVTALAFIDNTTLASASADGVVRLWNLRSRECIATLDEHHQPVLSVAFDSISRTIASGDRDGKVIVWDLETQQPIQSLKAHSSLAYAISFSPDGRHLVTGSGDNSLIVWNTDDYQPARKLSGHEDHIHVAAFSPTGRWLATGGHESLRVWSGDDFVELATFPRVMIADDHSLAFHPDGKHVAAGSEIGTIGFWNLETLALERVFSGHTDEIRSVAFSPDGSRLVSASIDNSVKIWDVQFGKEITSLLGYQGHAQCVSFSPDGRYVAAGLDNGNIKLWASE